MIELLLFHFITFFTSIASVITYTPIKKLPARNIKRGSIKSINQLFLCLGLMTDGKKEIKASFISRLGYVPGLVSRCFYHIAKSCIPSKIEFVVCEK